jgi:peroxiredoxin-like protein
MANEHNYEVNLHWKQDRKGELSSPVLNDKIEVVTPPEFPKGIEGVWSPEHLFTAAVSSCLMTTFLAVAENSKLDFVSFDCKTNGKLEMIEGKYMMSEVELSPKLVIKKEEDRERAERILIKSEAACLISNSIKSKIVFKPEIIIQ